MDHRQPTASSAPVRVFVACTAAETLPMRVLAHSIRETSSLPVEVSSLAAVARAIPLPADLRNHPRTPFSFQRFLIPELCGFQGRAIYLDADMLVFGDIAGVWNQPMEGHDLLAVREGNGGRRGQFSVMLLDCGRLRWRVEDIVAGLDAHRYGYEQLMQEMCVAASVGRTLSPHWNSLEHFEAGVTQLLHYTDMNTQPWVTTGHPLGQPWLDCLRRALAAAAISLDEVRAAVAAGHVRPSLLLQLEDPGAGPAALRQTDRGFVAPYKSIRSGKSRPWLSWRAGVSAYARRVGRLLRPSK
ncbi:MAG: glycosyl transferase family 8 [Ramlibacter sp.]|nr:glycosyl transferase family 8 [Ramlibacter sp.]